MLGSVKQLGAWRNKVLGVLGIRRAAQPAVHGVHLKIGSYVYPFLG